MLFSAAAAKSREEQKLRKAFFVEPLAWRLLASCLMACRRGQS